MAQGILGGVLLGAAFSVGVAGVISLIVPMQPQPAPEVGQAAPVQAQQAAVPQGTAIVTREGEAPSVQPQVSLRAPSGEELPKEPSAAALAPQTTTDLGEAALNGEVSPEPVTPPQSEVTASLTTPSALPAMDEGATDSTPAVSNALPQPQTGEAADLTQPRPLPQGTTTRTQEDDPVLPNPQALAPMMPDDSPDAEIAAMPQPDPQVVPTEIKPAPDRAQLDEGIIAVEPAPQPDAQEPDTEIAQLPKPRVLTVPSTQVGSLSTARPRVGTPATTLINRSGDAVEEEIDTVTPQPSDGAVDTRPISRYAQPFQNPEGKPLMGIVLMDTGADLDAAEIGLPALSSFPYPLSFAVDANLRDAAERVELYRAEGFDVLAMVNLPEGARPTDAEVSLSVVLNGMPEIVGVLEGTGTGLQGSREVADQVTRILQASGHGLVAQSKGLNSMPKLALKAGVPAAPVFRDFDSQGQQPRVIRRFLDQAAFKAGQEGGVIMLGRLRPETIEALLVWGLADRAGTVALAPVSAVLLLQQ